MEALCRQPEAEQGHQGTEGGQDPRHRHGGLLHVLGPFLRHQFPVRRLPPPGLRLPCRCPIPRLRLARVSKLRHEPRHLRLFHEGVPARLPPTLLLLLLSPWIRLPVCRSKVLLGRMSLASAVDASQAAGTKERPPLVPKTLAD